MGQPMSEWGNQGTDAEGEEVDGIAFGSGFAGKCSFLWGILSFIRGTGILTRCLSLKCFLLSPFSNNQGRCTGTATLDLVLLSRPGPSLVTSRRMKAQEGSWNKSNSEARR